MENATYVPTSLQSPALMVLASTAEASREAAAAAAAAAMHLNHHHPFGVGSTPSGGGGDKDMHGGHGGFTSGSFASLPPGFYGAQPPSDATPFAHLLHMHAPFLAPNMDRALSFMNSAVGNGGGNAGSGGGAFRPVTSMANVVVDRSNNGFHSAFIPTTKYSTAKFNELHQHHHQQHLAQNNNNNSNNLLHAVPQAPRGLHPGLTQMRPSHQLTLMSVNSAAGKGTLSPYGSSIGGGSSSTNSVGRPMSPMNIKDEGFSDHDTTSGSDLAERLTATPASDITDGTERSTPDEANSMRRAKKRQLFDGQSPCCPICGVTLRGGEFEIHFIHEIERLTKISRLVKKSSRESALKNAACTTPSGSGNSQKKSSKDSPSQGGAGAEKSTSPESRWESYQRVRTNRQGRLSARTKVKKRRTADEIICPICNERVSGTAEELNAHAEQCLHKRDVRCDEDEPVDVEGESYEEYEWAGQTRIRATTLLQGGFSASGFQTANTRNQHAVDEDDIDLNVDGDDSATYGQAQYTEVDMIPCSCDESAHEDGRNHRGTAAEMMTFRAENYASQLIKLESDNCRTPDQYTGSSPDSENAAGADCAPYPHFSKRAQNATGMYSGLEQVIASLKKRIRELEEPSQSVDEQKSKCRICMGLYNVPLVSVSCWHIHCEECWLRTLGAKKLCPQCNMITSPSDLRRIYL